MNRDDLIAVLQAWMDNGCPVDAATGLPDPPTEREIEEAKECARCRCHRAPPSAPGTGKE